MRIHDSTLGVNTRRQQNPYQTQNVTTTAGGKNASGFTFKECLGTQTDTNTAVARQSTEWQLAGMVWLNGQQMLSQKSGQKSTSGAYQSFLEL